MASRSASSSSARQPNVRRNLFNPLSRRPTTSSSTTSATTMPDMTHAESADIVVKDQNGRYQVQIPVLPVSDEDQAVGEGEGEADAGKDRLDPRFIEMYRSRTLQPGEPAELLPAVQASLRRKVASLDADNWMFEAEDNPTT